MNKLRRRGTLILLVLVVAQGGSFLWPDPAPAARQEENAEVPRGKVKVLEPLPEEPAEKAAPADDPGAEPLKQTLLDERLVEPPEPAETLTPEPGDVLAAVREWALAWSNQDVERYLSHYARDFEPDDGQSRADWEAVRRLRVTGPEFIKVDVTSIEDPRWLEPGRVVVGLRQIYNSDTYGDVVDKEMVLVLEDGDWKILREVTAE